MASDYENISRFNEKKLGEDRASRMSQVAMYADTAHFVYELLQNADDAGATEMHFTVSKKQLVVEHNGTPFAEDNVKAISYFGKGKTDITKIGHFGLGFKSVFAYTATPLVHSGGESFEISQLYSVAAAEYPNNLEKERTRFVFPFDHHAKCPDYIEPRKWKSAKVAYEEIAAKLANLGAETLLFTKVLTEINWETESNKGHYLRDANSIEGGHEVYIITDEGDGHCYLVFDRLICWPDEDGNIKKHHPVQIAFGLNGPLKKNGAVVKVEKARLFVFFPTYKESHVGFIIQGPYRTTPARDNIPEDDDFNCYLVEETAALLKDGINSLKKLGLLKLDALAALPINYERFKEGSFFYPLYSEVRDALSKLPLLPTACGGFISGAQAKLARGKDLVELFSPEQLSALFDKEGLKWLDASLTDSGATADLHSYLVGRQKQYSQVWEVVPLFEGMQINADTLVPKLTAEFLSKQPMDWLIRFIRYAMGGAQRLKEVPFIRLESGKHVSLPSHKSAQPPAWFSPNDTANLDLTVFSLVHAELAVNEPIKKFLEKEGIHEIDAAAIVGQCILPLYKSANRPFDESSYREHLRKICEAYTEANDTSKNILTENLNDIAWLACVHASGSAPDRIVWKKPEAHDLFAKTSDHVTWFQGLSDINAYFLHPSVNEELKLEIIIERLAKPCKHLWRENEIAKRFDPPNPSATTIISWAQNNYQEAQEGFHPNAEIYGLKIVLINSPLPMARAQVLWRTLIERPHLLRGFVLKAKRVSSLSHAPRSPEFSCAGKRLLVEDWLPDKGGDWHKPNELLLTDLHNGFETTSVRAKEVAESLGMKRPEQAQALEKLGQGDPRRMKLLERIASATYDELGIFEKLVPKDIEPQPAPPFKDGLKGLSRPQRGEISQGSTNLAPVSNPGRYQNKLGENVEDAFKAHLVTPHTVTFSPVRIQESNSDARNFLYSEYQGRCQLTGHTFLKASANAEGEAENYFEACALLSYSNASYLNDAGNMLSVSADTMAKFKHASVEWVDDLEKVIDRFKNREPGNTATASIRLAGEEALITWSERHFMRLIALWNKA